MDATKLTAKEIETLERIGDDLTVLDICDYTSAASLAERREAVAAAREKITLATMQDRPLMDIAEDSPEWNALQSLARRAGFAGGIREAGNVFGWDTSAGVVVAMLTEDDSLAAEMEGGAS